MSQKGTLLGVSLIGLLVFLLTTSLLLSGQTEPAQPGAARVFLGLYIFSWGAMFLASYHYSHKTFFLRALMWLCENYSVPQGRSMAFFYAFLCMILGLWGIAKGLGLT